MVIAVAFFILSGMLYGKFGKPVQLFIDTEPRSAQIEVKYPEGTTIEKTDAALLKIESIIGEYEDIEFIQAATGQGLGSMVGAGTGGTHVGSLYVKFVDEKKRGGSTTELITTFREEIGQMPGAEITVEKEAEGPPPEPLWLPSPPSS